MRPPRHRLTPRLACSVACLLVLLGVGTTCRVTHPGTIADEMPRTNATLDDSRDSCTQPWPTLCGTIPSPQGEISATELAEFAWQTFIALSWPADDVDTVRGVARDPTNASTFGQDVGDNAVPLVWETWKQDWELFVPGGQAPTGWNSYQVATPPCTVVVDAQGERTEVTAENWPGLYEQYGRDLVTMTNQPKQASNTDPAPLLRTGPLIDQNHRLARAESRFGETIYDYITSNEYYLRAQWPEAGVVLPAATATQPGAITAKASWRPATTSDDLTRFYWRDMLVAEYAESGRTCTATRMLLVGLHITFKSDDLPYDPEQCDTKPVDQFLWATFEQVDNVPPPCETCSFYGSSRCDQLCQDQCKRQGYSYEPTPRDWYDRSATQSVPPVDVCRLQPIEMIRYVATANTHYHALMAEHDTPVWSNYQLVNLQWMQNNGGGSCTFRPTTMVANTTLETYDQTNSCMNCHRGFVTPGGAASPLQAADADFNWTLALQAYPPPTFQAQLRGIATDED